MNKIQKNKKYKLKDIRIMKKLMKMSVWMVKVKKSNK